MKVAARWRLALLLALSTCPVACIPSNVVAREDRMVGTSVAELQFAPMTEVLLQGLFESVQITGDAAVSLRKVYYLFFAGGSYTAAALIDDGTAQSFQTLSGTWQMSAAGLSLDGAEAVPLEVCGEHLRLSAPGGVLVLRRGVLQ